MMTVSQSVKYFDSEKSITHMTTVLEVASDTHMKTYGGVHVSEK